MEVLSFGHFIDLYQLYYQKYPSIEHFSSYLWSLKFLRNAAAHNNCLLNSLKAPYNITLHKNRDIQFQVSKIKSISEKSRNTWMQNPVIHDFVILVYVYLNVVKSEGIKQNGIRQLKWLFEEKNASPQRILWQKFKHKRMLPFYPQSGKHLLQQIPQIRVDRYIYTSYNNYEDQKTYMVFPRSWCLHWFLIFCIFIHERICSVTEFIL